MRKVKCGILSVDVNLEDVWLFGISEDVIIEMSLDECRKVKWLWKVLKKYERGEMEFEDVISYKVCGWIDLDKVEVISMWKEV